MSVTAFNRRRRELAAKRLQEKSKQEDQREEILKALAEGLDLSRFRKDDLLAVALELGLDVSEDNVKKEIISAIEETRDDEGEAWEDSKSKTENGGHESSDSAPGSSSNNDETGTVQSDEEQE